MKTTRRTSVRGLHPVDGVGAFVCRDVCVERASRGRAAIVALLALVSVAAVLRAAEREAAEDVLPVLGFASFTLALVLALWPAIAPEQAPRRVTLRADARGVHAGSRALLARRRIASAGIERRVGGTVRVLLFDRAARPLLAAELPDQARANGLLAALGLDAARTTLSFVVARAPLLRGFARVRPALWRSACAAAILGGTLAAMRALRSDMPLLAFPPALVGFLAVAHRLRRGARVIVGRDAVVLQVGANERVLACARIARARAVAEGTELELDDGEIVSLRVRGTSDASDAHRAGLVRAIDLAIAGTTAAPPAPQPVALPARDGAYREAASSPERLWDVVESPAAPARERAAALAMLARDVDDSGRARFRALAASTAAPRLRVALDAAADGDLARLERALDALAQNDAAPRS